jgi:hypothetical protein
MRRVVIALVLLVVGLPLAGFFRLQMRNGALGHALALDAVALERTSLSSTAPGTEEGNLLACVEGQLALVKVPRALVSSGDEQVTRVRVGGGFSTLSAEVQAQVSAEEPLGRMLPRCARFRSLEAMPAVGPLTSPTLEQHLPEAVSRLMTLAPLLVRRDLEWGGAPPLQLCGQALVLAAALLDVRSLEGMLGVLGLTRMMMSPCTDALAVAPREDVVEFLRLMQHARAFFPAFSRLMEVERVQGALRLFGPSMSGADLALLPPGARDLAMSSVRNWREALALPLYWARFDVTMRRLVTAQVDQAAPARTAYLHDAMRGFEAPLTVWLLGWAPVDPKYDLYAGEVDDLRVLNDMLVAGAHVRLGEVPVEVPGVTRTTDADGGVEFVPVSAVIKLHSFVVQPLR